MVFNDSLLHRPHNNPGNKIPLQKRINAKNRHERHHHFRAGKGQVGDRHHPRDVLAGHVRHVLRVDANRQRRYVGLKRVILLRDDVNPAHEKVVPVIYDGPKGDDGDAGF